MIMNCQAIRWRSLRAGGRGPPLGGMPSRIRRSCFTGDRPSYLAKARYVSHTLARVLQRARCVMFSSFRPQSRQRNEGASLFMCLVS